MLYYATWTEFWSGISYIMIIALLTGAIFISVIISYLIQILRASRKSRRPKPQPPNRREPLRE